MTDSHDSLSSDSRPAFAVTIGDPLGIGPEIIVKSVLGPNGARWRRAVRLHLFGPRAAFIDAGCASGVAGVEGLPSVSIDEPISAAQAGADVLLVDDTRNAGLDFSLPRTHSARGGAASFAALEAAIARCSSASGDPGRIEAVITAPISKTSWKLAGIDRWPGHTELLAERFNAPESGMLFVGPSLRVMLVTIHVPLVRVREHVTTEAVLRAIRLAHRACIDLGDRRAGGPRIAVCGLNPHAGEGGLLGDEDDRVIAPAIARAREQGIDALGPLPGDTAFGPAVRPPAGPGAFDAVVAMFHDQGLIPSKLLDGLRAVNVTVGLPIIRTSPAHGTAFDIAGRNRADPASMIAAIDLALEMWRNHSAR